MEAKRVQDSQVEMSYLMGSLDSNGAGAVHGGVIMKLVDTVGGTAAVRHAGSLCVTAAIDEMSFIESVLVGDTVTLKASVNDVGRSSIEVGVRVEAKSPDGTVKHTSSAYLVFVAIDRETRRPVPVPPLIAETRIEKRRMREAKLRREARLKRREEILRERGNNCD